MDSPRTILFSSLRQPADSFTFFPLADNKWEPIPRSGDPPGCLQEHTMVGYRDTIYVFGGEVGFSNGVETPLWMFDIKVRVLPGTK